MKNYLSGKKPAWLAFLFTFIFSIGFAVYTRHAWEDWYITYRCAKNLALGNGLVYQVGQRVHAFTSPLGTLVPALISLITFNRSDVLVLWLFRLVSSSLLGFSAVFLLKIARKNNWSRWVILFFLGAGMTNINIVDFSINGMETAFMIFFLTYCLWVFITIPKRSVIHLGLAWAGLMWTRPDSFVYIGALAAGHFFFMADLSNKETRQRIIRLYLKALAILIVLYLPWLAFASFYYGSPIPHTILAKGLTKIINYGPVLSLFPAN